MPNALREAGYHCELHDDHFAHTTEDAIWLSSVAEQQWIVLTKDERIRYRPLELHALRAARRGRSSWFAETSAELKLLQSS